MSTARSLVLCVLCLSASTAPAVADVLIVAGSSPYSTDFPTIQGAIDASADGDTIVVRSGTYGAFAVDGRELSIVAAPGANVVVNGSVRVEQTPIGAVVLLAGLKGTGDFQDGYGLRVRSNAGFVRVQDCSFTGRPAILQTTAYADGFGAEGAIVESSAAVSFTRCTLSGKGAPYSTACCSVGYTGGHGIWAEQTPLALYDCALFGGIGSPGGWGGFGGDGLHLVSNTVFASGTSFTGGNGGFADDLGFAQGGNGGNGISVNAGAALRRLATTAVGGAAGGFKAPGQAGVPGQPLVGAGSVVTLIGSARKLSGPTAVVENSSVVLTVVGQPGDRVYLEKSLEPGFAFVPGWHGVKLFAEWPRLGVAPLAVISGSGTVSLTLSADDLATSTTSRVRHMQLFVKSLSNGPYLGSALDLVVFECGISGDCNQNGVPDLCDVQSGTSADCNSNGVPDECDIEAGLIPDCNQNGVADACDISSGTSTDCNGDGVPDECDYDCNGNGTPDACDISSGTSTDCDLDGLPDECNLDCNGNGIADTCDITGGTSLDLNGNGVPDECQSASDVYYVAADALPHGSGTLSDPFDSISKGVAYAIDGNNVVLLDGIYTGAANREVDFGGRQIVVRGLHGAANTIIDCENAGRAFVLAHGEPAGSGLAGLTIRNGAAGESSTFSGNGGAVYTKDSTTTIANCRFENCAALVGSGGAVYAKNSNTTFANCRFENCDGWSAGGGIRVADGTGSATITNCVFLENHALAGGAVSFGSFALSGANALTVKNSTFAENDASIGAAVDYWGQALTVVDSSFDRNTSFYCVRGNGGPIAIYRSRFTDNTGIGLTFTTPQTVDLIGCRFQGNQGGGAWLTGVPSTTNVRVDQCLFDANSGGEGAALRIESCQNVTITHTTSTHNVGTYAGGLYVSATPAVTLFNSIVWNDSAPSSANGQTIRLLNSSLSVFQCDLFDGQSAIGHTGSGSITWGAGNLNVDPLFVSENGADGLAGTWADNSLSLGFGSPCIDAGNNGLLQADVADLDGDGDFGELVPRDLALLPRRVDDPLAPDVGSGAAPLTDMGAFERQP